MGRYVKIGEPVDVSKEFGVLPVVADFFEDITVDMTDDRYIIVSKVMDGFPRSMVLFGEKVTSSIYNSLFERFLHFASSNLSEFLGEYDDFFLVCGDAQPHSYKVCESDMFIISNNGLFRVEFEV